jgi:serine/threonine protein kinase/formylglycine-generating enzyme required for sulfatase activity
MFHPCHARALSVNPPTSSDRSRPRIHDHEVIRLIGRGAYGEVWLARSVTGALRAVKVVWRADYDYPEAFEREFEAIKRYEPVSRKHAGLVPILQVGRSEDESFYYYVMELADDVDSGRDFTAETYRPLTLMARMRKEKRLTAAECLQHGATIAEALHFMHQHGLIHRDVKPSNLIFTDGVCRLADIGLVALLGQRSFVGTEGFVAPEGPGTAQSDIFSLGMVLYEASTGKDRLDFPDLPTANESGEGIQDWRRLHNVVCRACSQKADERFENAMQMADSLRGESLPMRRRTKRTVLVASVMACLLAGAALVWLNQGENIRAALHRTEPMLTITTVPDHAEVYSNGAQIGTTPLSIDPAEGVPAIYQVRLAGYRIQEIYHIASRRTPATYELKLEPSKLPQPGERWENSLKMSFLPKQTGHTSERPVEMKMFDVFLKATNRPFEGRVVRYQIRGEKAPAYIVVVPSGDAEAFRYWLADQDRGQGYITNEHHYEIEPLPYVEGGSNVNEDDDARSGVEGKDNEARDWQAFSLRVERQGYGGVIVRTNPEGVKVFQHEDLLGITPLEIPRVKSGEVEYELRAERYTDVILEGEVRENEMLELFADMQEPRKLVFGREWKNSMGNKFIPLGEVLMAATETRRRDFGEYAKATNTRRPPQLTESQLKGAAFPVIWVDRNEARAFCEWLTKKERDMKIIEKTDRYRLPTDEEWSRAAGLPPERGKDPAERNGRARGIYPWGYEWPPPKGVDNFADMTAARKGNLDKIIRGYEDRFPTLAAVTVLPANSKGFVGLAGNVSEWVDTDFESAPADKTKVMGTVRGGSWRSENPDELLSSARQAWPPTTRRYDLGFRIVLARGTAE